MVRKKLLSFSESTVTHATVPQSNKTSRIKKRRRDGGRCRVETVTLSSHWRCQSGSDKYERPVKLFQTDWNDSIHSAHSVFIDPKRQRRKQLTVSVRVIHANCDQGCDFERWRTAYEDEHELLCIYGKYVILFYVFICAMRARKIKSSIYSIK